MVVDLDDSEITFKSPPLHARIKRKSIGMTPREKLKMEVVDNDLTDPNLKESVNDVKVSRKKSITALTQIPENDDHGNDDKESNDVDTLAGELRTPSKRIQLSLKRKTPKTDKKKILAQKRKMLNETV